MDCNKCKGDGAFDMEEDDLLYHELNGSRELAQPYEEVQKIMHL